MQKRLARKLDLERLLSRVASHPSPNASLEQYTIPPDVAAAMLFLAAYVHGDVVGKSVLDLGCGTGRLALGAAFLGAEHVVGVDIDRTAIRVAVENSVRMGLRHKVQWITADIEALYGEVDTILQNPPYGVQTRHADRQFLKKAMMMARRVYSLHKSLGKGKGLIQKTKASSQGFVEGTPSPFLKKFIAKNGGRIDAVYTMPMIIPHMFGFHTKRRHEFLVDLYVLDGKQR